MVKRDYNAFNTLQDAFTLRVPAAWHVLARFCYIARRLDCTYAIRAPLSEHLGRSCVQVRCRLVLSVHLTAEAGKKSGARRAPALSFPCIKNNSIVMESQSGSPSGTYAEASGKAKYLVTFTTLLGVPYWISRVNLSCHSESDWYVQVLLCHRSARKVQPPKQGLGSSLWPAQ